MNREVYEHIIANFPFEPTPEQDRLAAMLAVFVTRTDARKPAFILKGYAGTGKTTVVGALVKALAAAGCRTVLMAPTGRAAKVFSLSSGHAALTIHKKIYRQKSILDSESFQLDRNLHENTLFLVDEASMISNDGLSGTNFGTGRLLDDLVDYVYSGRNCRLLLLGDVAQLPPVGQEDSPALLPEKLELYGIQVTEFCLREVMRQGHDSGILYNATCLRQMLEDASGFTVQKFKFRLKGFADVIPISGSELTETISTCYSRDGIDETMVLCRSNKRAQIYNNGIRATVLDREDELCRGDSLMVVKNNYFWTEMEMVAAAGLQDARQGIPSFIANGDIATVRRVRRERELYGFRFVDAVLCFPDYSDYELEATLLLDTLHSESPALSKEQQDSLFANVMEDYAHIGSGKERMEALRKDRHFNALQVKYAYAVTCHKAQGGQWMNIFIDQGYMPQEEQGRDCMRWLYTALTRSTERVYLVNWPEEGIEK